MTSEIRKWWVVAAVTAVFVLVHEICAWVLAGYDLLGALLNRMDIVTLLLGLVLAFTRAVLFFLVPGWLTYRAVRVLSARAGSWVS